MARPYRIQYPGAIYHVMNRGLNRRNVFKDKNDFQNFLNLCENAYEKWGLEVFAYCLMSNHYHLCVRTPEGNLSRIMRHLDGLYTQRFNRRHDRDGPLFRGRYKAIVVQEEEYLSQLVRYIHLNPVKAGLAELPKDYSHSSHQYYVRRKSAPAWLNINLVRDGFKSRKTFDDYVRAGSDPKLDKIFASKRHPIVLGAEDFVKEIKKLASTPQLAHARHERQRIRSGMNEIIKCVVKIYDVSKREIIYGIRGKENEARKVAMWAAREYGDCTHQQIAKAFNVKSTHTVGWSCRQIADKLSANRSLKKKIKRIQESLGCQ